jgi:hypothetical protein
LGIERKDEKQNQGKEGNEVISNVEIVEAPVF